MSLSTFKKALDWGASGYVTIGGGEPTIHPEFEHMLIVAIAHCNVDEMGVHVITNGLHKQRSLLVARLGRLGVIGAELSQDDFHESVSEEVVKAFRWNVDCGRGYKEMCGHYHDVTTGLTGRPTFTGAYRDYDPEGFAASNPMDPDECCCPNSYPFIKPNGDVRLCGCEESPTLGNVHARPVISPDIMRFVDHDGEHDIAECYRSNPELVRLACKLGRISKRLVKLSTSMVTSS